MIYIIVYFTIDNMKTNYFSAFLLLFSIMTSCGTLPHYSRFSQSPPQLGTDKANFLDTYGPPFRFSNFYNEDGFLCEELIYRETINHGGTGIVVGELRAVNSIFLFVEGELVSQFQEDDISFLEERERDKERELIEKRIKIEQERIEIEKERIKKEK